MSVFTKTWYPAGPLTAAYAHLSTYFPMQDVTLLVPFAGKGKLVHAEAHVTTAVASSGVNMEIQNNAGTAIGDIAAAASSAVGTEAEWTADASSESDYTIDNGHIKLVSSSLASAGAVMVHLILEPTT